MKSLLLAMVAFFALPGMVLAAVNLNTATKEELDAVKGIGPVKAQAIIDYRKKNGPLKSVDELSNVSGFGDKTVAKMRSGLTVNGAAAKAVKKIEAKPVAVKAEKKVEAMKTESKPAKAEAKAGKEAAKEEKKNSRGDKK